MQLRAILEAAPVPVYTTSVDGLVTSWNGAAERQLGWPAAEVLGQPVPLVPRRGAPGDLVVAVAELPDGTVVVAHAAGDDARLHVILDAIPAPIFYKDADGIYRGCNHAFASYLGKSRQEIVGASVWDVAPPDLAEIYRQADLELFASQKVQVYENSVRYADGSRHDVIFNKATFRAPDGTLGGLVGTILDITARKQAERALQKSEERYRAVVAALEEGIVLVARDRTLLTCNGAALAILGLERDQLAARLAAGGYPDGAVDANGEPLPAALLPLEQTLASGAPAQARAVGLVRGDGSRVWVSMNARSVASGGHDDEPDRFAVVLSFADITEQRRAEERLQHQAFHDALTGLPNRALFFDRLAHALAHARRRGESLAVAYLDLDRFKLVNDTFGHEAGDRLLVEISRRLMQCARQSDTVARMGGDEFMVVLPGIRDRGQAAAAARRMLEALRPPLTMNGRQLRVSVSIGVTLCPHDGDDVVTLMRNADRAMYRAKELGKNDFRLFGPDDEDGGPQRLELENQLHRAIDENELRVEYQPQIDLRTGATVAVEALLRWHSRRLGLVMPDRIIPLAEETGMIVALGEWVLREACARMAAWVATHPAPTRLAVNVSPVQFRRDDFIAMLRRVLAATGLSPRRLELELREGVMMGDAELAVERIGQLHALGVSVAIDDFGTGYSSLSYLRRLPVDTLKIDRSCVQDLEASRGGQVPSIVQPIITLAHSLGMAVVAEGVETQVQLGMLRELGCDRAQGWVLARPQPELS